MSIESRIKQLERKPKFQHDHVHWMVPEPSGGMRSPNPKDCKTCIETEFTSHFVIMPFDLRIKRIITLDDIRSGKNLHN